MSGLVNKEEIMLEWVRQCPLMTNMLLLNWLIDNEGAGAIIPISETVVSDFNDKSKLIHYDFMLQFIYSLSDTTDTVNTDKMLDIRKWQNWIEEQDESGNFPDFGAGYDMQEIQNLAVMPNLAQTFEDGKGKYQFPARLIYLKN